MHILAKRHVPTLELFARSNVLLGFDYDGTLAPIVSSPRLARMRSRTRRLLTAVAGRYPCVIISGRALDDVARRVAAIPVWHVSGSHGVEPWGEDPSYAAQVRGWVRRLERLLDPHAGVIIEDKGYSVAVHYRHARDKRRALRAIRAAVGTLRGSRVIGGDHTVNLVPRGAPHKGTALERARRQAACEAAIYVGDDETDEDVFAAGPRNNLLGIRIGRARRTRACYRLKDQREIDRLLAVLLAFRPIGRPRDEPRRQARRR
jgi:trehalose 6-phosphate phosphatase